MKTIFPTNEEAIKNRGWAVVDADGQVVGRLASEIAQILRGKHNPLFTPHNDSGDFVVVLNAGKVRFTGNKLSQKPYRKHTGFVGGLKEEEAAELLARKPEEVIFRAVRGMLPKSAQGRRQLSKLKIYRGSEHPHSAQNPRIVSL